MRNIRLSRTLTVVGVTLLLSCASCSGEGGDRAAALGAMATSPDAGTTNNNKVENVTPVASDRPVDLDVGDLQMVAEFEQQVVGVAVSASGRVFVSFPRNGIDTVKNSVEEVIKNKAVAYPNKEINTLNTAAPSQRDSFACG